MRATPPQEADRPAVAELLGAERARAELTAMLDDGCRLPYEDCAGTPGPDAPVAVLPCGRRNSASKGTRTRRLLWQARLSVRTNPEPVSALSAINSLARSQVVAVGGGTTVPATTRSGAAVAATSAAAQPGCGTQSSSNIRIRSRLVAATPALRAAAAPAPPRRTRQAPNCPARAATTAAPVAPPSSTTTMSSSASRCARTASRHCRSAPGRSRVGITTATLMQDL